MIVATKVESTVTTSMTDEELCRAAASGDRHAFDELVRRSLATSCVGETPRQCRRCSRCCSRCVHPRGDRSKSFVATQRFEHGCIASLRIRSRTVHAGNVSESPRSKRLPNSDPSASVHTTTIWDTEQLATAVDQLPDGLRAAVILHDVYEFTSEEVAESLDISAVQSSSVAPRPGAPAPIARGGSGP